MYLKIGFCWFSPGARSVSVFAGSGCGMTVVVTEVAGEGVTSRSSRVPRGQVRAGGGFVNSRCIESQS